MGKGNTISKCCSSMPALMEEQQRAGIQTIRLIGGVVRIRVQCDRGANISVTQNESNLHSVKNINDYYIGDIGKGIKCTKRGIFYLRCNDGKALTIKMHFSANAKETVVSPMDAVASHSDKYNLWQQASNVRISKRSLCVFSEGRFASKSI